MARVGLDWHPYAHAGERSEQLLEIAVAMQAADLIDEQRVLERRNLATEIGNNLGPLIGRALSELGKALR